MNIQTIFFKVKAFFQILKRLFTNMGATAILVIGIVFMAAGFAVAFQMRPTALLPISISWFGALVGGLIIARALPRFVFSPSNDSIKLEKANAEIRDANQTIIKLNKELEAAQEKATELQHRLQDRRSTSVNVTAIQPVMKIIASEISFDVTDFYEKLLGEKHWTHLTTRRQHLDLDYYRGCYNYKARQNVAIDLQRIKVIEKADVIELCGPFEYEISTIEESGVWYMFGRCEHESCHGDKVEEKEIYEINIEKMRDRDLEDEQKEELKKRIKS